MKRETLEFWKNFGANWTSLLAANVLLFPFMLPLAAWIIICQCYSSLIMISGAPFYYYYIISYGGLLLTTLLYFIGLSGYVNAVAGIVFQLRGDVRQMFKEGLKKNVGRYLLNGLAVWGSATIAVASSVIWLATDFNVLFIGAAVAISLLQTLIVVPTAFLNMAQNVFFEDKMGDTLKNSLKILLVKPSVTLFAALAVLPFAITIILPFVAQTSAWILYGFAFVTFSAVSFLLKAKRTFDGITGIGNQE